MRSRRRVVILFLALLAASMVLPGGLGSKRDLQHDSSPVSGLAETDRSTRSYQVHGYPLDRSLGKLVNAPDLDVILVVDGVEIGTAVELTSRNWSGFPAVVTTARARVDEVLLGPVAQHRAVTVVFPGGAVDGIRVHAGVEIGPSLDRVVSRRLLLAGSLVRHGHLGEVLEPNYVYEISSGGTARSLIESGGPHRFPGFTLDELRRRLDERGRVGFLRGTAR